MGYAKTVVREDSWDVEPRLRELGLTISGLRRVRDVAMSARSNVTAFHAANASGTLAYQDGVWCLRDEFVGSVWQSERPGGVEAIVNMGVEVRVAFANVDLACHKGHDPQPISSKGAGSERLCEANLFKELPTYAKEQAGIGVPLFYCMVDEDGRVELSQPTIQGKTFGPCIERNFISLGPDDDEGAEIRPDTDDSAVNLEPSVVRKVG